MHVTGASVSPHAVTWLATKFKKVLDVTLQFSDFLLSSKWKSLPEAVLLRKNAYILYAWLSLPIALHKITQKNKAREYSHSSLKGKI